MSLEVSSLRKRFGAVTALSGISFRVPEGSVFGLLGSNGSGKTTAMRLILRILLPDGGSITWRGRPLTDALARTFGYLPEERGLYLRMRVGEQLIYLARLHGMPEREAARAVAEWLERMGIAAYRDRRTEQLSKGNQQKVQFVAAVAHRPPLVLLDEPFSGLDPLNVEVLEEGVRQLVAAGATVILSSHRLDLVESLCSHVALIHRSRLLWAGALRDLKAQQGRRRLRLMADGPLDWLDRVPGAAVRRQGEGGALVDLPADADLLALLRDALAAGRLHHFEVGAPPLQDIYFELVRGSEG